MGRATVIPVETIVSNAVDTYIADSTLNYPSFLDSAPILVTYYSRAAYKSTHDPSFQAFNEVVGDESPNRYHKIEKLPVYSLEVADFSTEITENGLQGEVTSTCMILPDMINPKAEDLIEVVQHTSKYLFRVTGTTPDNYGNSKFYKLTFSLSSYTVEEANRQVEKVFEVDFDLIGRKANSVLPKNYANAIKNIREIYDEMLSAYSEQYYHSSSQTYANKVSSTVDQFLNHFIVNNELNVPFIAFRNSNNINPLLSKYLDKHAYSKTFLSKIEKLRFTEFGQTNNIAIGIETKSEYYTFNYFLKEKVRFVKYLQAAGPLDIVLEEFNLSLFELADIPDDIVDSNLIFLYHFSKYIQTPDLSDKLEILFSKLSELEVRYFADQDIYSISINDYYLTPLILFALKHLFHLISNV